MTSASEIDRAVAIIPARGGSKRLPRKNIYPVLGVPMLAWVIRACQASDRIDHVAVSTEDPEIAAVAERYGARVVPRPNDLAGDTVFKQDVIAHAFDEIVRQGQRFDVVLSVQPNSPEVTRDMLDEAIEKLRTNDLYEVFSVDRRLIQTAAFRVMRSHVVHQHTLSVYCGVVVADLIDVHTIDDVAAVEGRLRAAGTRPPE
jgi:CMP-N-acetylneuraminic acid synthetase